MVLFPGGLSIGVPGEVSSLWEAHKLYGRVPWADLVEPAVKLAREGWSAPGSLAYSAQTHSQVFTEPLLR